MTLHAAILVIGLPLIASAAASPDEAIRAEVGRVLAAPDKTNTDAEIAAFKLRFDLHLTNRSISAVSLSGAKERNDQTTRITLMSMQSKQPNGTWRYIFQSTWVDDGTLRYDACTTLAPAATLDVRDVETGFVVLKKQLDDLGSEPVIRFTLWFFCQRPDGKVPMISVTTDPFSFRLSRDQ